MERAEALALIEALTDNTLETLLALAPAVELLRHNGNLSARTFGRFHDVGMPVTLVLQSRPGRERERVEASLITGSTVQLAFDFGSTSVAS